MIANEAEVVVHVVLPLCPQALNTPSVLLAAGAIGAASGVTRAPALSSFFAPGVDTSLRVMPEGSKATGATAFLEPGAGVIELVPASTSIRPLESGGQRFVVSA